MLIGVDDDKSIPGVKFPEEESIEIHAALKKFCRPGLPFHESIIPIYEGVNPRREHDLPMEKRSRKSFTTLITIPR